MPNGTKVQLSQSADNAANVTEEFKVFNNYIESNPEFNTKSVSEIVDNSVLNLPTDILHAFSSALYKIKNLNEESVTIFTGADQNNNSEVFSELLFEALLNKHNGDLDYVGKNNSLKNSIVSKIKKIISMPSNQLLANEPVSIDALHEAGAIAKEKLGYEDRLFSA